MYNQRKLKVVKCTVVDVFMLLYIYILLPIIVFSIGSLEQGLPYSGIVTI